MKQALRIFHGTEKGPVIAFLSGSRADDVNTQFILMRLCNFLYKLTSSSEGPRQLIQGVAVLNGADQTLDEHSRSVIADCYYRIELSAPAWPLEKAPQVLISQPYAEERATACLCGLNIILEMEEPRLSRSVLGALSSSGGENFLIELGQQGVFSGRHCERVFHAVVNLMYRLGVLGGIELAEVDENLHYFVDTQICPIKAEFSGFFVPATDVGRWVHGGDVLGWLYDIDDDEREVELRSPLTAMVSTVRRAPNVLENDELLVILARDN